MARSLSSQKRQRQNVKLAARNKARKSVVKSKVRKVRDSIQARDAATAQAAFLDAVKVLDRDANRRTIHPNTAARRKSRLARQLNAAAVHLGPFFIDTVVPGNPTSVTSSSHTPSVWSTDNTVDMT